MIARRLLPVVLSAAVALLAAPVFAQPRAQIQQVLDLNRQAMEAYTNLDIDQARSLLERALSVAGRAGVTGGPLATTHRNLAVVMIAGLADNDAGLQSFVAALRADPNIRLDPLTATPEIRTVFALAQARAGSGTRPPPPPPDGGGDGGDGGDGGGDGGDGGDTGDGGDGGDGGGGDGQAGDLEHEPPEEQLQNTPLPLFTQVPRGTQVGHVYLFYKGLGMADYRRVEMPRVGRGYGYQIPCSDVFEPAVEYYIAVFDNSGGPVGFAGTRASPLRVPIVRARTRPAPALPGRSPPATCSDTEECPPGMEGCHAGARGGLGDPCTSDAACAEGLECDEGSCGAGDGDDGDSGSSGDAPRFFLHLGGSVGVAYLSGQMSTDVDATTPIGGASPDGQECPSTEPTPCAFPDGIGDVINITSAGFTPTFAVRALFGMWFIPRLGGALGIRYQPDAGQGSMSHFMIYDRLQYLLTPPTAVGVHASVYAGAGGGQIQPKPDLMGAPVPEGGGGERYVIAGLGAAFVGGSVGYRFVRNFGLWAEAEIDVLFPTTLLNIDISAGVGVYF